MQVPRVLSPLVAEDRHLDSLLRRNIFALRGMQEEIELEIAWRGAALRGLPRTASLRQLRAPRTLFVN